ncbi:MAG: hypothetical protein B1H04_06330 [Planctomycetales bacterium 4484_123]|nr:MAG: hypothetical protein B1H04_06330 [Planctomycetales bacterium 4484_123]
MEVHHLIVAVAVVAVGSLVAFVVGLRRRWGRLKRELTRELQTCGEAVLIGPEAGSFRGARRGYGRIRCDGIICATERRVIFQKLMGSRIEIALSEVTGIREARWFLHRGRVGWLHLILIMRDGNEIGFYVRDNERWKRALDLEAQVPEA